MKYLIIGNSAAAIGAIEGIRKVDRDNPITLISDEPYHTYSRPLISYYLMGKVTEKNMLYRKEDFYEKNKVEAILGIKATQVDTEKNQVVLEDGRTLAYDKLLIATGGTPFIPYMEGLDKENVFSFLKLDDIKAIIEALAAAKKAVIVGAGLIGLKAAEGLVQSGVDVTVVELANRVLSAILDEDAANIVQNHLENQGIKFELNTSVESILGNEKVSAVKLKSGKTIDAELVIVAVGVKPNTGVVSGSSIQINRGIIINEHCQTNIDNIYAAGDVAEGYDLIYNTQRVLPILPNAYKQGEVAGLNMAGKETEFKGGFAMNSIGFFRLPMITAGIIKPEEDGYEILVKVEVEKNSYKKIVIKEDKVVGFIFLKNVDRAGIITSLISEKINVKSFKEELLKDSFGYIDLPKELRKNRLMRGGVA